MKKIILFIMFLLALPAQAQAELVVHFLDVGQGDAALVLCDGESMLIDGGPTSASQLVYTYVKQNTDRLDYIVATHPHEDHIGGLAAALNAAPVDVILSPVEEWDSSAFQNILKYADLQGALVIVPYEGDLFTLGGADVLVLHCWPEAWDTNDMSIVLRIDYGATSFIFTGDAEAMSEYMMIDSGFPLKADVLKVGHHGSSSSSSSEFVATVDPAYAVISCGRGNAYGHPHPSVLEILAGVNVLRTDEIGTIVIHSDGQRISVENPTTISNEEPVKDKTSQKDSILDESIEGSTEASYIGNRNSMKFHYPYCPGVEKTSPKNRIPLFSREEAIALGYAPCGQCNP